MSSALESLEWSDDYSVSLNEIDEQHKVLFGLLEKVRETIVDKSPLEEPLQVLVDYTVHHFKLEEEMMEKAKYVHLEAHKAIHKELLAKVINFQERIKAGETGLAYELMLFLQKWLVEHILEEDMQYAPYIKKNIHKMSWWKRLFS